MDDLEKKRNEVEQIISSCSHNVLYYISEFDNFEKNNDQKLYELNNENFDILVKFIDNIEEYKVENNYYYFKVIDYIIQKCKYQTLNYTIYNDGEIEVPLFLAIYKGLFKIADLLIERGANINYLFQSERKSKVNIIQYIKYKNFRNIHKNTLSEIIIRELGQSTINNKTFNYIFSAGFNIESNIMNLISDLLTVYNYDKLENLFKNYVFGNNFILSLLSLYKNKIKVSKLKFDKMIKEEKTKLKIEGSIYYKAAHCYNSYLVGILIEYDGDDPNIIFEKIIKNNILGLVIINNNKKVIEKITKLDSFDIQKIDFEKILKEFCYKQRFDFTNSIKYFYHTIKCKFHLQSCDFNSILNNVIVYASKTYEYDHTNKNTVKLFIEILYGNILSILTTKVKSLEKDFYCKALLNMLNLAIKIDDLNFVKMIVDNDILKPFLDIYNNDENGEYSILTAYNNYIERNKLLYDNINLNTDIIEYLLKHGPSQSSKKKYLDKIVFFKALEDREYLIFKYILKFTDFPNNININFSDVYKGFQLLKIIPPSKINELISLAGIHHQEDTLVINIFSDPIFISFLHKYVKEYVVKDDDIELYTNLLKAIYENDFYQVKSILTNFNGQHYNLDILDRIINSFTPLTFSYLFNRMNCFEFLLPYCNINNFDGNHHSLLHYAVLKEDTKMVERLLNLNIDLNPDQYKNVIELSIEIGYKKEIIAFLLEKGVNINYITNDDDLVISPLRCAVELSNKDQNVTLIKYLIENGAIIEKSFESKEDLLFDAVYERNLPLISYLIKLCVNINYIEEERTPLSVAIEISSLPMTKLLVEHDANVHQIITDDMGKRKSLLMYAIEIGEKSIINLLMQYHARIEFYDKSDSYKLIEAIKNESFNLSNYLKQQNINIVTPELIKNIISDGRLDLIRDLVKYQLLDINVKDDHGETPIFYAIKYSEERITKFLIKCGADLTVKNNDGETIDSIYKRYSDIFYHHSKFYRFKKLKIGN
ncbi:hypothetical protein PIROE2DRAFT_10252 [Piromyces sp. E2]|nr:hypothetical protein PIROE2DRAFT_10252 [Piromyces sp. E2]|eukprot:OUM63226.1 hypothetical protein PIROE2DRAFT_10252 [Piromyces sp. E2]